MFDLLDNPIAGALADIVFAKDKAQARMVALGTVSMVILVAVSGFVFPDA